jgi:hypothetical protein
VSGAVAPFLRSRPAALGVATAGTGAPGKTA